ncbi:MAG TPA: 2-phospho-L-lactate transferase [Actinomycetota bacterium]
MKVVALAGGIGAGKFLRGLVRAIGERDVTVVVNTGDDIEMHGLRVSPDLDSVTYWLAGEMDRERGWGRRGESFRATGELAGFDPNAAWFNLGDLDLATHLFRTRLLAEGVPLSEATRRIATRFGVRSRVLPMSDDRVTTRIVVEDDGGELDLHFQEYWVRRGARDRVVRIVFEGAGRAVPAPALVEALDEADAVVVCPSNPVVSIGPVLSVPGIREAVAAKRPAVVGVSPIVAGAPLGGMADKVMPPVGLEVSALGAAQAYRSILGSWVIDTADVELAPKIEEALAVRVAVTDTLMRDDDTAEALARVALSTLG